MKRHIISTQLLQIIDGGLAFLAIILTAETRGFFRDLFGLHPVGGDPIGDLGNIFGIAIVTVPFVLETLGFYNVRWNLRKSFRLCFTGVAISSLILVTLMIALKLQLSSRYVFLGVPPLLLMFLMLRSLGTYLFLKKRVLHSSRKSAVQLIGTEGEVADFLSNLSEEDSLEWELHPAIDLANYQVNQMVDLFKERSIAKAVFICSSVEFNQLNNAVEVCESMGIEAMVATDFLRTKLSIPEIDSLGNRTMITLRSTPSVSYSLVAKKLLDRVGAGCLILATSPLWIFAAIGIRWKSPKGPIFFKQQRAGLYGRPFTMWKFRSMHPDAEYQLNQIKAEVGNEMDGPVFKLENDPRVFSFGNLIRRTSIDELPQLINVFLGDMSLVGPRPLPVYEVEEFQKSEYRRRLSVKPGITCFWQAGGRNSITDFEDWVALDLKYIDNWSFWLDLKILCMTIPAVLCSKGAK